VKKRKKKKWRWVLGGILSLCALLPVILWFAVTWLVRAAVSSPVEKNFPPAAGERISKSERQQLEDILKEKGP
jgi:hypothetical protein